MHLSLLDPVANEAESEVDEGAHRVVFLDAEAEDLGDELLATNTRKSHGAVLDVACCHAQGPQAHPQFDVS